MPQVSLRIQKLKCSNIAGTKKHNQREYQPDNADPEKAKLNEVFIGSGNIDDLVFSRISEQGAQFIESGKNASTIAVEMVISASPEYFRDDPSNVGMFDQQKMADWRDANLAFLQNKYGDNLVRVDLHLDETTPHMHAIITPLVEKQRKLRGKNEYKTVNVLDAKNMFNRSALVELQTESAQAVAHLGIDRGIRHSKAKHTDIKQFYAITQAQNEPSLSAERIFDADISLFSGFSKKDLQEYANNNFQAYEQEIKKLQAKINQLTKQLDIKKKQVEFISKHQGLEGGVEGLMKTVNKTYQEVVKSFNTRLQELSAKHKAAVKLYRDAQGTVSQLEAEIAHIEGYGVNNEPDFDYGHDEEDLPPELSKIDVKQERENAKKKIDSGIDLDDGPSI